jgi:hypothetical protein
MGIIPEGESTLTLLRRCSPAEAPYMRAVLKLQVFAGTAVCGLAGIPLFTGDTLDLPSGSTTLRVIEVAANVAMRSPSAVAMVLAGAMAVEAAVNQRLVGIDYPDDVVEDSE